MVHFEIDVDVVEHIGIDLIDVDHIVEVEIEFDCSGTDWVQSWNFGFGNRVENCVELGVAWVALVHYDPNSFMVGFSNFVDNHRTRDDFVGNC